MASTEHLRNAGVVKKVHADLREQLRLGRDFDTVWSEHLKSEATLKEYSECMMSLATQFWTKLENDDVTSSRINWVYNRILEYYFGDGRNNQLSKDQRRLQRYSQDNEIESIFPEEETSNETGENSNKKLSQEYSKPLKLLDVGSCYNPFSKFSEFEVTALDIAPAIPSVLRADFLNLCVQDKPSIISGQTIEWLESGSFDAVVFCLLLEYLPTRRARYECCDKARSILKDNGVLVLITPDSCHATRNSRLMKGWREALQQIGFQKVYYEKKQHFHGLVYRKLDSRQRKLAETERKDSLSEEEAVARFSIPQDSSNSGHTSSSRGSSSYVGQDRVDEDDGHEELSVDRLAEDFNELPNIF